MRYRMLDADLDYSFGQGQANFYTNVPEAVGQYILTRMNLWLGQWFYDTSLGVPWMTHVLGERTQATRDIVVQQTINQTPGVRDIAEYASVVDRDRRTFAAGATVDTVYGAVQVGIPSLPGTVPPLPAPPGRARLLGLVGSQTVTGMQRADLSQPGQQDIATFVIRRMDAGAPS